MSRAASLTLFVLAAVVVTGSAGCTSTVRSATHAAVPVVVDESLGAFEDPQNRERLEKILGSPEMQAAIRETSHALVRGALEPGTDLRVQEGTAALTDTVAEVLARDLRDRILPATVQGMRESLRDGLTTEDRRAVLATVNGAIAQATATALRSASAEMPRSFGPAVQAALVESLNSPELHAAVAGILADAARASLLSSRDLLVDLHQRSDGNGPVLQLFDRVQRMLERTVLATFAAGALLGALFIWAMRYFRGESRGGPSRRVWPGPPGGEAGGPSGPSEGGAPRGSSARLDPSATRAT
jgi:hypothetical protein